MARSALRDLALVLAACLIALAVGALLQHPGQQISIGPGDARALVGFYEREESPSGAFRWARPGAALFLYGFDGRPAIVTLRLNAARPADAPARIELHAGERGPDNAFVVGSAWRRYVFLAPTNPTNDTPLWFGGESWRPTDDERDLVVALSAAQAIPAEAGLRLPPFERTVFLLSFPLLAWLIARRRTTERFGLVAGLLFIPLLAWAVARPAAAGYLLPTFGWPWWPFVPLTLVLIAARNWSFADHQPDALHAAIGAARTGAVPREGALLAGITLLAFVLRLVELDALPLGLWRDEARHGMLALQIWRDPSFRPVYVVEGADLPALLFYLMAPVLGMFGPGVASVRLVSAMAGALVPLALWWAAHPLLGSHAAVLGAALLAWSSWALSMSRWGFPATLDQLLTLAAIGLALRSIRPDSKQKNLWYGFLSGVLAALAAYAYHTGRLTPLVLALLVALMLGRDRASWRRALPGLAAAVLAGLLVLVPLLWFIAGDFSGYNRRTGAVAFYTNEDAGVHAPLLLLLRNAQRYLLMWHVAGDANGRHHAPGAPMVDAVSGVLLLLGVLLALAVRQNKPMRVVLAWLALGMLPGLLSTGAPHAMRGLPALAPACVLAGMALAVLYRSVRTSSALLSHTDANPQSPNPQSPHRQLSIVNRPIVNRPIAYLLTLALSAALNLQLYFVQMPRDPRVQEAFDVPETMIGRLLQAQHSASDPALRAVRVFVPSAARKSEVVQLFADGAPPGYFDPSTGLSALPSEHALLLLPAGASDEMRATARAALGPAARELDPPRYPDGHPVLVVYGIGENAAALLHATFSQ